MNARQAGDPDTWFLCGEFTVVSLDDKERETGRDSILFYLYPERLCESLDYERDPKIVII